jgi:hypothetical protein
MTKKSNLLTLLTSIALMACGADAIGTTDSELSKYDNPVVPTVFWATDDGQPITENTPDSEPMSKNLVMSGGFAPLFDTDGSRITWGEARAVTGTLKIKCQSEDTKVQIKAEGLRPNGVYTGWLAFFQPPGFAEVGLASITAISPVGPADGSESVLIADELGRASLTASVAQGMATVPLGGEQDIPSCLLETYELHVVLAYHPDGNTCGDNPCAEDRFVEQAAWIVTQEGAIAE